MTWNCFSLNETLFLVFTFLFLNFFCNHIETNKVFQIQVCNSVRVVTRYASMRLLICIFLITERESVPYSFASYPVTFSNYYSSVLAIALFKDCIICFMCDVKMIISINASLNIFIMNTMLIDP